MDKPFTISVGELREDLADYADDDRLYFGDGDLTFVRVKSRGKKLVAIEFNELYSVPGSSDENSTS